MSPDNPKDPPTVKVDEVRASGNTAVVPGEKATVDGQTLNDIVLSHSSGVDESEFAMAINATRVGKDWYVSDLRLSTG